MSKDLKEMGRRPREGRFGGGAFQTEKPKRRAYSLRARMNKEAMGAGVKTPG